MHYAVIVSSYDVASFKVEEEVGNHIEHIRCALVTIFSHVMF